MTKYAPKHGLKFTMNYVSFKKKLDLWRVRQPRTLYQEDLTQVKKNPAPPIHRTDEGILFTQALRSATHTTKPNLSHYKPLQHVI